MVMGNATSMTPWFFSAVSSPPASYRSFVSSASYPSSLFSACILSFPRFPACLSFPARFSAFPLIPYRLCAFATVPSRFSDCPSIPSLFRACTFLWSIVIASALHSNVGIYSSTTSSTLSSGVHLDSSSGTWLTNPFQFTTVKSKFYRLSIHPAIFSCGSALDIIHQSASWSERTTKTFPSTYVLKLFSSQTTERHSNK